MAYTFEKVDAEVASIRNRWGQDSCSDAWENDGIAGYTVLPGDPSGYRQQYRLADGASRSCGLGNGCFWTEWKGGTA